MDPREETPEATWFGTTGRSRRRSTRQGEGGEPLVAVPPTDHGSSNAPEVQAPSRRPDAAGSHDDGDGAIPDALAETLRQLDEDASRLRREVTEHAARITAQAQLEGSWIVAVAKQQAREILAEAERIRSAAEAEAASRRDDSSEEARSRSSAASAGLRLPDPPR